MCVCLDVHAPAAAQNFSPGMLEASFSSGLAANSQDMFDQAFGETDSSPFGAPPVATVPETHKSYCAPLSSAKVIRLQ